MAKFQTSSLRILRGSHCCQTRTREALNMTFRGAQRVSLEARRKKAKEKMMLSQAYVYMPSGTVVWELTFPQLYEQKVLCSCFMHCVIWRSRKAFAVLDGSNMISQGLKDTSQSKNNLLKQPISAITIF